MARGVTARRRRNMGRVRKLQDMRAEGRQRRTALGQAAATTNLAVDSGPVSGRLVIEAKAVSKDFQTPHGPLNVVSDLNLRIMRGDRLGVVGPNGAGKTTLLRLLLGRIEPDAGAIRRSRSLEITYLDQTRTALNAAATLRDTLTPLGGDQVMVRGHPRHVAAYARDFMFDARQLSQPVGALSGGERNRLTLALALAKSSNLLVLDEPTNDLDLETLDLLEDMLCDYDGTLLLVSHDRAFIDNVVTSVLTPEGGGRWLETPGGYSDYASQSRSALRQAAAAETPSQKTDTSTGRVSSGKLSYKDQRRLEELERLMPDRQQEISRIENAMADPNFFSSDPQAFGSLANRLTEARTELDGYEFEWLELEEKRQSLQRP